jgi:ADP-heptose:LPS heptosyltransferase
MICEIDATVILFGSGEKDRLIADEIEHQVRQHNGTLDRLGTCISISKEHDIWPIRRSLAQVQVCDLVVTPDTGPQWAVAQLPMPKIVLLSHSSAENITKYAVNTTSLEADRSRIPCFPCHRLHSDYSTCTPNFDNDGPACITDLSVEAIVQAARLWLTDFDRARALIARPLTTEGLLNALKSPAASEAEILSYEELTQRGRVLGVGS